MVRRDAESAAVNLAVGAAKGGVQEERGKIPAAPAERVKGGVASLPRAPVGRRALVVSMPGVLGPLRHVAEHVVEPEGIRVLQADRMRGAARVLLDPRDRLWPAAAPG